MMDLVSKKILIHVCCAPCAVFLVDHLHKKNNVTLFFFNPNIMPKEEYEKRLAAVKQLAILYKVELIVGEYCNQEFLSFAKSFKKQKEGSIRCQKCYEMRLLKTCEYLDDYDFFVTSLINSPFKDSKVINEIGKKLSEKYLPIDFDNKNYQKSRELSKKYNFYRQKYCGCCL